MARQATRPNWSAWGVATSTRGYAPFHLTHYKANWVSGSEDWPVPSYPLKESGKTWDKATLVRENVEPWRAALEKAGCGRDGRRVRLS